MVGSIFDFDAEVRTGSGRGDARRSRKLGKVPAIVYGAGLENTKIYLAHHKVIKALENESVYSHVLNLNIDGKTEKAVLKALQRHPSRPIILHMDFQRVSETDKITMHVPLHFVNQENSLGVKKGGNVSHLLVEVEVTCLPQHLPEFIEVDMVQVDLGQLVHLSDLTLPQGVELVDLTHGTPNDRTVASIHTNRPAEGEA